MALGLILPACAESEDGDAGGQDEAGEFGDTIDGVDDVDGVDGGGGSEDSGGPECLDSEWIEDDPTLQAATHVSISQELAAVRGVELGDQVRIERSGAEQYALFTVHEVRDVDSPTDTSVLGMNADARFRLGMNADEPEVCAHLVTKIAPMPPEFVELARVASARIVILAPHGGSIEKDTDAQADTLAEALADYDPSTWTCVGEPEGGGAFRIWHIPSAEISPHSFPLLDEIDDQDYDWAVSFHGFSVGGDCTEGLVDPEGKVNDLAKFVIVGGLADREVLGDVRDAIAKALGPEFVVLAPEAGLCAGKDSENLVNWLAIDAKGVQIEAGADARSEVVAQAVALALQPHLGPP